MKFKSSTVRTNTSNDTWTGFTVIELLVIVVSLALMITLLLPKLSRAKAKANRISCVSYLKQLGVAYKVWAGDNQVLAPAHASVTNGGWKELALQTNAAAFVWTNYGIMANELGQNPRVLVCPEDNRAPASDFTHIVDNSCISYFASPDAGDDYPQSFLGGDRNLAPGLVPKDDFGYSLNELQGNDVRLLTNSPVCWSLKLHSRGSPRGAGNLLLGDSSVQQASSARFREEFLANAGVARAQTNSAGVQTNAEPPSIRLLFP
jgi:competence protein ComGC